MSDDAREPETQSGSDEPPWIDQDEMLGDLVAVANSIAAAGAREGGDISLEIDIILTVGGFLVSGRLISAQQYFAGMRAQIEAPPDPDNPVAVVREKLAESFDNRRRLYNNPEDTGQVGFIHLRDVTFLSPGSGLTVPLWRARLTAVDGFTLGRLG